MTFIFDFDGTLTNPFPLPHADAMREMMVRILVSKGISEYFDI